MAGMPRTRTHDIIFVKASSEETLARFAPRAFSAIGITSFEERESSNYIDGHYMLSKDSPSEVTLCYSDEDEGGRLAGYRFWMDVNTSSTEGAAQELTRHYATLLANNGMECFVPSKDWWHVGWGGDGESFPAIVP